ncbi:DUF1003 domain-containing protein [Ferrovibrio sp.]|uniref:DUF1003 domain-containing protein n=1 Tax=Ferrovibrio sp. TaxID=1917215 RepID=UPI0025C0407E|nr:DUF1003 domain-containing protein [Ferrovibrio sp.]MBX3453462.1 DUF1003 domain-containing protein [Ferrovibrio sp.]
MSQSTASASSLRGLTPEEVEILHDLRRRRHQVHHKPARAPASLGQRIADGFAGAVGSWNFVVIQSLLLAGWIVGNVWFGARSWDPYPFILLNLLLSFQAAYTAPVIMMSQNRMSELDRRQAEEDYHVNVKAELEIEWLHHKIDLLREQEIITLTSAVQRLSAQLDKLEQRSA